MSDHLDIQMTDDELYAVVRRIGDLFFELVANEEDAWVEDRRRDSVNPFYNQTKQGLFLEVYYGAPSVLWTPWGKWGFTGPAYGDLSKTTKEFLRRLGAVMCVKERTSNLVGVYGPVYALYRIDDQPLPAPIRRASREDYLTDEEAELEWERLTAEYNCVV